MGARSAVATVAWLATDHQQLMYLLSPEGKTVFYIPGVEVVHKVSTPINLPEESNKNLKVQFTIGLQLRTCLTSALYKKALVLAPQARQETTVGQVVNLMSSDVGQVVMLGQHINFLW